MYISDLIRRSGRNLRSSKVRTLLTALAIAVGAFTLSATLAASNGLRNYTDQLVATNFDPTELFVGRDPEVANNGTPSQKPKEYDESVSSMSFGGGTGGSLQLKRVTQQDVAELQKLPYVSEVRENLQFSVRYITRSNQKKYTAGAEAFNPAQKPAIKAGSVPANGDVPPGSILLPDNYLEPLGFDSAEAALGKSVQLNVQQPFSAAGLQALSNTPLSDLTLSDIKTQDKTFTYKILAVTKKPATSLSFGVPALLVGRADARVLYDFTTKGTTDYGKYLFVYVRVKDGGEEAKLTAAQKDLKDRGYYVQSSKDIQKAITQIVNILTIMVGVFGFITVVASIFGIVNTQYISVLERTREIGLMKALGMSRKNVSRLFMVEAAWIGFLGGLLGVLVALTVGSGLNPWITNKLDLGEGNNLLIFRPWQLALLILALMVVATMAGLLPARKAAKLDPIEALRTE